MERFCNGAVTIDEQMFLVKEDTAFYNFIGLDIYAPISDRIHPDDVGKLRSCLDDIMEGGLEKNATAVRIRGKEQDYAWFSVEVVPESFKMYGRRMFNLRLMNLEESANEVERLKDDNVLGLTLLSMTGNIFMEYDIGADCLKVFSICGRHQVLSYDGNLDGWQVSYMNEHVKNLSQLKKLCLGLRMGTAMEDRLSTNAFSEDGSTQLYEFKLQPMTVGEQKKTMGVLIASSGASASAVTYEMDPGINILNKKSITAYARNVIMQAKNRRIYLAIIDLDNFKTINDKFGHMFGDEVLAVVAAVVKEAVADNGLVGRIGGDEMFVVIDKVEEYDEIRNIMRNIRTNVEWYYKDKRDDVNLTCSIGVAQYPLAGEDYETVFSVADKMLYRAKEKGRNRYIIYNPEIHGSIVGLVGEPEKKDQAVKLSTEGEDIKTFYRLMDDYLIRRSITNEEAFCAIGATFGLDEVVFASVKHKLAMEWTHAGYSSAADKINVLTLDEDFRSGFDDNNLFVINGRYNLKNGDSEFVKELGNRKIESAIFYKIVKNDEYQGYIMFAKENVRQQWSKYEITALATAGKVIELVLMG
jgi:diguanylate cyclase (GGDEF)-like protein